jgi:hypothetical protein
VCSSADQPIATLSGGNQQKALVARWLATAPRVWIADEPTRGVDVGARGSIERELLELAASGRCRAVRVHSLDEVERLGRSRARSCAQRRSWPSSRRAIDEAELVRQMAGEERMQASSRAAQIVRSAAVPLVASALLRAFNLLATPASSRSSCATGAGVGAPLDVLVRGAPLAWPRSAWRSCSAPAAWICRSDPSRRSQASWVVCACAMRARAPVQQSPPACGRRARGRLQTARSSPGSACNRSSRR